MIEGSLGHHGAIIQDGMDCDERDMEPPPKSLQMGKTFNIPPFVRGAVVQK
jgi:hypothetical protein